MPADGVVQLFVASLVCGLNSGDGVLQVFVAGGSGRLGARIVRELLTKGFKVRVGVRDQAQGETLLKTAVDFGLLSPEAARKAQIVEFDLLDESTIAPAIGPASKVIYFWTRDSVLLICGSSCHQMFFS